MILETTHGPLHYDITDVTPAWNAPTETIVLCHGVATNCDIWSEWVPILAPHFRVVRFDTRGFGRSLLREDGFNWSLDALANDIVTVAHAAGAERFHLVGESMGGTVALHLAARANSPVLSLCCASTAHRGTNIHRVREWRDFVARQGMQAWSLQMMEHRFYPQALSRQKWEWFHGVQSETRAQALLDVGDLLVNTDLGEALGRITVPTLLLTPDASPFVTVDISNEVHKLIKHSELTVFPGSRHGLPFSHARECAQAELAFLKRHGLIRQD